MGKEGSAIACQAEKILKNHKGDTPTSKILEEETEENKKVLKKYDKSNWFNPIEYFTRAYDLGKEISSKNEKLTEEQLGNGARPSKDLGDGIRHSLTSKEFTDYVGVTRAFIGGLGAEVKGSWNQIKKLELPDFKDSEMDMYNNYIGIRSSITRENINTGNLRTIEETDISTYPIKDWSQYFPTINLNIDKAKNGTLPPQK